MKVYFSHNRIDELQQYYQQIMPLFYIEEQNDLATFLMEIENDGCCDIELYNNIYSILNKASKRGNAKERRREQKAPKGLKKQILDVDESIRIIDLIRLQFATRYYFTTNQNEVGNEQINHLQIN